MDARLKGKALSFTISVGLLNEHSIMSKTSRGYLDSEINPDTMLVTHQWRAYDDSADDGLANSQSSDRTEGNKIVKFIEGGMRRLSKGQR